MTKYKVYLLLLLFEWITTSGPNGYVKAQPAAADAVEFTVDTDSSRIFWRGTEMWQTGKHEGTVGFSSGSLLFEDDRLAGGRITADMNSITITDIPEHEVIARRNLRDHLKSDDFFLTEKYPTAVFEVVEARWLSGNSLEVLGDLTIRDVTKAIAVDARLDTAPDGRMRFQTDFTIDRFDWNIAYQGSYWEKISSILDNSMVDREIQLSIRVVLEGSPI